MPPSDWIRLWLKVPLHPGSEWQVAICTWPRDSGAMAVGEELPATKPPGVPGSVVAVLPTPASMSPAPPPDHPRFASPCKAAPKAGSRPVTPRTEARAADGPLCLLQSRVLRGQRLTRHKAGARPEAPNLTRACWGGAHGGCSQARSHGPTSAHLGEGGHSHAVGPLLEGAGRLGGEGSGRGAIVGGREGQVVLVQEVARAAALPLLQAAGTRGQCLEPGQPPRHPERPGSPHLSPFKGVTRSCSCGLAGSHAEPVAHCHVCQEGPGRCAGPRSMATPPPQLLRPSVAPAAILPLPRGWRGRGDSWETPGTSCAYCACRAWAQRGAWSPNPDGPQTGPPHAAPGGLRGSQTPPHRASLHPAPQSRPLWGLHGQG